MTPVAEEFWGSVIRHLLTMAAGVLVTHGYVAKAGAGAYVEELTGVLLYGLGQAWSSRAVIANRAKMLLALWMPAGATEAQVNTLIAKGAPTPALTTPPDTVPGVPLAKT